MSAAVAFRALPAIDLREGAVVQLVGGSVERERIRRPDPLAVARELIAAGLRDLHVVDLDAALGCGHNRGAIAAIAGLGGATLQVGGGLRDAEALDALFDLGVTRAIVGTRAIEEPSWLAQMAARHPGRILLAADVRGREIQTRGWARGAGLSIASLLERLGPVPLAGLLVTAVHKEGLLRGPDLELIAEVVAATSAPVFASGGIRSIEDLRALKRRGAAGAVVGMALYTGEISMQDLKNFEQETP
jgi:phosphoribosylformimino-5-aminoimidazole carboxamide ribotide isomerase